ncbi:MAG TPA: hypothetical protein VD913_05610 [bacterium]|nr:hypothetical protein [bacterium]
MASKLRIIVTGLIAQHPHLGGMTWHYLQYAAGLSRLGHDVYYFEDSGEWPYYLDGTVANRHIPRECKFNIGYLSTVLSRFGLQEKWAYCCAIQPKWFGLPAKKRSEVLKSADLLLNVSGALRRPDDYRQVPRLAYIDSDPVFTQIKLKARRGHRKFQKRVRAHDIHFSFGECLSEDFSAGLTWLPTRNPILLSDWEPSPVKRNIFTTVMNWTSYTPLKYQGQRYGQKDFELIKFVDLPRLVKPVRLEIALTQPNHMDWQTQENDRSGAAVRFWGNRRQGSPVNILQRMGWHIVKATKVCPSLDQYRAYIASSKAEWSIAKNGYVRGKSGWFSERSACYLAAGKPVVVQDTGFGKVLPVGKGILAFTTLEQARHTIEEVNRNYKLHAKAAREIAEAYFDSDKVLGQLVEKAMTAPLRSVSTSRGVCHAG